MKDTNVTLLSLDEDVKRSILGHMAKADLRTLCLIPDLRDLAEPSLYRSIDLTWQNGEEIPGGGNKWEHALGPLVRTLLRRPALTEHIREITYQWRNRFEPAHPDRFLVLPERPLDEAVAFVERTNLPYVDEWKADLQKGRIDAYLAILLSQLPNVRQIYLGPDVFTESNILGLVLRSLLWDSKDGLHDAPAFPGTQPGSLRRLESVRLDRELSRHDDTPNMKYRNTTNLLPLFSIPLVKTLAMAIESPDTPTLWPSLSLVPVCHHLVHLTIDDLRQSHLGEILSVVPNLESFHWRWQFWEHDGDDGSDFSRLYNRPVVDMDLIIPALEQVKSTLTELNIHAITREEFCGVTLSVANLARARSLATFPRLTKLALPFAFVAGFDPPVDEMALVNRLPPTLEYLTIHDDLVHSYETSPRGGQWDEPSFLRMFIPWLENWRAYTPRLRRVRIVIPGYNDDYRDPSIFNEHMRRSIVLRNRIRELVEGQHFQLTMTGDAIWFPEGGWEADAQPAVQGGGT